MCRKELAVGDEMRCGLTVDLPEHLPHTLHIVEIKEPRLGITVVLLKRDLSAWKIEER